MCVPSAGCWHFDILFYTVKRERENQQDATIRCLLSTLSQHVLGIIMPIFRRTKTCVTADGVLRWFCCMWLVAVVGRCVVGCEHCEDGQMIPETCWDIVDNKHLIVASCWFSLCLHNLLTMHDHRNLKFVLYWFCPPCCDHCGGLWVTALVYCTVHQSSLVSSASGDSAPGYS